VKAQRLGKQVRLSSGAFSLPLHRSAPLCDFTANPQRRSFIQFTPISYWVLSVLLHM
jgi:hypothetical protein